MKTKLIATFVAVIISVAQFATAQSVASIDSVTAVTVLGRAKRHVPSEAQKAIDLAIAKINGGGGGNDLVAAEALTREANSAQRAADDTSKPAMNRQNASEDAKALRYAAAILSGGATVTTATTSISASSSSVISTSASAGIGAHRLTRSTDPVAVLNRMLAEDRSMFTAERTGIRMGILALQGGTTTVSMPGMWARGLLETAERAHSLIGNRVHWVAKFGVEDEELIANANWFAEQDEIALRAASAALSKLDIAVVASSNPVVGGAVISTQQGSVVATNTVQRTVVAAAAPVVTTAPPPVVPVVTTTTTATTVVAAKKATPKPCKTTTSVAPVNATK